MDGGKMAFNFRDILTSEFEVKNLKIWKDNLLKKLVSFENWKGGKF